MTWTCAKCGGTNEGPTRTCGDCGHIKYCRLILLGVGTSSRKAFTVDTPVTDRLLRTLVGEEARFASPLQFTLRRKAATGGWTVSHEPSAKHPTYLDGAPVTAGEMELRGGETISIGPERAKLSVVLGEPGV